MKIICEYCKNSIDTDKNDKCPNCNASYHNNKEFKDRIKELQKEKEIELETRRLQNETYKTVLGHTNRVFDASKFIIIGIVIFIMVPIIFIGAGALKRDVNKAKELTNTTTKEIKVEANLGQYAETSEYKVMVDKVINIDKLYNTLTPSEGKEYKIFHIIVQNKLNKLLILPFHINCVVDDFAQKEVYYISKYPSLPSYVEKDLKVEGYALFEVPKGSKKFDIKYGDYVTIHIEEE